MASKTQLRLAQLTGSIGDGAGQVNDQLAALATGSIGAGSLDVVLSHLAASIKRIHGHAGSFSESAAGTFHQTLVPGTDDTYDLGSASAAWQDLHLEGDIKATDAMEIDTAAGALTIDGAAGVDLQEGGVSILNIADNRNVTVANAAAIDIDGSGAVSIDSSAGSMTVGAVLADGQTLKLGKNGAVEVIIAPHGTAGNEKYTVTNTAGTAADAISLNASAGGILINADASKIHLDAEGTGADAIDIDSAGGLDVDAAGAVAIDSTAGSITMGAALADGQTLKLGKNGAAEMIFTPHGTPANEKISLVNTAGTADDAILIDAAAGGLTLAAGDDSLILDADGTDADALKITSAGGMDVDVADEISLTTTSVDGHISLVSAHTAGVALHIDADANAGSIVDIDAGILDVDAAGAASVDAGGALSLSGGAASKLTTSAGNLVLSASAGKIELSGSSGADSVHVLSDMTIAGAFTIAGDMTVPGSLTVNGTTTTLDTANLLVQDPVIVMGVGAQALNSNSGILFTSGSATAARPDVALGRIDTNAFGIGSIANPNSGSITSVASMTSDISFRADSFQIAGGTNKVEIDSSNIAVVSAADIVLNPGGNNVLPGGDSEDDLGASGTAWRKLFVDDISLAGQGRLDLDADSDTSIRASSDDVITFEAGAADVMSMSANGLQIADDKALTFGTNNDVIMEYDEDGNDVLNITGATLRIGDDQLLQFGAAGDAGIEYDEDGSDQLRIHAPAAGVVIGGTTPKLVIGDAGAEDTMVVFDGNAVDFRIGLDDGTDTLEIGVGAAHGTTTAMTVKASDQQVDVVADLVVGDDLSLKSDSAVLNFGDDKEVNLTHVHDNGLLLNSNMQLQFGDSATRISQVADGVLHLVADQQILMDGGGGLDTHFSGSSRIGILDNNANAFAIQEGKNNYLAFVTSNGSEKIQADKLLDLNADLDMQGSRDLIVSDGDADALEIKNASAALHFTVNTQASFVGVPDNILLGAGTGRDLVLSHDGANSSVQNNTGPLMIDSKGGNLILTGAANNAEIQLGDAFSGAANITGGALSLAVSISEYTNYISNFAANKSIVGALNDLASGGTRSKFQVAVTGSHAANSPLLINASLNHDQGSEGPQTLDVFVNGQLLTSGTTISDGDYKIGITSADHVQFFFSLENGDQVTVLKP